MSFHLYITPIKKICYSIILNISFFINSHVEASTNVIMLLGTMTDCKIIMLFKYFLTGSV